MADTVALVVDGQEYRDWSGYDIDSNMLIDADAFNFKVDNFWENDIGLLQPGSTCELYVNDWLCMTGIIDAPSFDNDKTGGSKLEVAGRSNGSLLVACSPLPGRVKNLTLLELAQVLCDPFGIEVVTTDTARARSTGKPGAKRTPQVDTVLAKAGVALEDLQPQTGDTVFGFLASIAEKLELACWMTADGKLCISRPTYTGEPQFALYRGRPGSDIQPYNNIIGGGLRQDWSQRFSHYTGVGQGTYTTEILGYKVIKVSTFTVTVEDMEVSAKLYKPTRQSYNLPSKARMVDAINKEIARRKFDSYELKYTVDGHSQNGAIWQPDTLCRVVDEVMGVDGVFYVVGRKLTRSRTDGTRTQVTLRKKDLWLA